MTDGANPIGVGCTIPANCHAKWAAPSVVALITTAATHARLLRLRLPRRGHEEAAVHDFLAQR